MRQSSGVNVDLDYSMLDEFPDAVEGDLHYVALLLARMRDRLADGGQRSNKKGYDSNLVPLHISLADPNLYDQRHLRRLPVRLRIRLRMLTGPQPSAITISGAPVASTSVGSVKSGVGNFRAFLRLR